jgi:hypothetical protein
MPTQRITLDLPDTVLERAGRVAQILQLPLSDIVTRTLTSILPDTEGCPPDIQAELMQMTWLSDRVLWQIARSRMSEDEQKRLQFLSVADPDEEQILKNLRKRYGQITLRKARAYALLSLRGGKPLLSEIQAN